MKLLKYEIGPDESITRWSVSGMSKESFAAPWETFDAPVNLGEGYVQIIYPVRREFLKNPPIHEVLYEADWYDQVYFPFENNRVDYTTFINTPHRIWFRAKTYLEVEEAGVYPFQLYTCGGVKIWINGREAACFAPYSRNIPQCLEVGLELAAGQNEIAVYADELAERDVFFYYELRYKGSLKLTGAVPVQEEPEQIRAVEAFLRSCYFPKDCLFDGELVLCYDGTLLQEDCLVTISGDPDSAKLNNVDIDEAITVKAVKGGSQVSLGDIRSFNVGVFKILAGVEAGPYRIERSLVVGLMPRELTALTPAPTLAERKDQALAFIAEHGETVVNRAMVMLETTGALSPLAEACIRNSLQMIIEKADCADFYLVPMLQMLDRYSKLLPDALYGEMKAAVLDFRYWIDEPGNDVMWYFSENHALLFHISQYLAGHLFPQERFHVSGRTGQEQHAIGKQRIEHWFETFQAYGYAEWNSATYIPIDLIGFFVLYEMAPDASIRSLAKEGLDFTFRIMMMNSFQGIMSSSYGRSYEDTLKAREQVEPCFLEWVAYGSGFVNFRSRAVSLFCLSSYEPPVLEESGQVSGREWLSVELDQGINKVKTYSFRTAEYFMGSVRRFKPFTHGHQQHLMNVALGGSSVQYYINHPGERAFSGGNRPSYWAGNGTIPYQEQYRNTLFMVYRISPEELVGYIHAYCTQYAFDEIRQSGNWLFLRAGDGYCGTYYSNGCTLTDHGANTGKEAVSPGLRHGVLVKCGSKQECGDFSAFCSALAGSAVKYDGFGRLEFEDPQWGFMRLDTETEEFLVNGQPVPLADRPEPEIVKGEIDCGYGYA